MMKNQIDPIQPDHLNSPLPKDCVGESTSEPHHRFAALATLSLVASLLAICWFVLDPLKYAVLTGLQAGQNAKAAAFSGIVPLLPRVLFFGGVAVLSFLYLVRLEIKNKGVSALLLRGSGWPFAIFGLSLLFWFTQAYFYPGHFLAGDTSAHIIRVAHFGRGLTEGKFLFWNNYFYTGTPFLQFYAPLFFWLGGALFAITDSIDFSVKSILFAAHFAGGVFIYAFLRKVGLHRAAALIGSIAYTGSWAHSNLVLHKGVLPPTIVIALLPLAFLLAERLLQDRKQLYDRDWMALALVTASMVAAHQVHGIFAGFYLALYVAARSLVNREFGLKLFSIACAGAAGIVISLFSVLPFLKEKTWVIAEAGSGPLFQLKLPTLDYFKRLLAWSNSVTSLGSESAAYLGLTVVILGLIASFLIVRRIKMPQAKLELGIILLSLFVLSIFLRGSLVRDVIFTLFFISTLAAFGTDWLAEHYQPNSPKLALLILCLVLLDLAPTAIQPVARSDKGFLDDAGKYLAEHYPNQRIAIATTRASDKGNPITIDIGPGGLPINYYPIQTVSGPHNHAATVIHNYGGTALIGATEDLRTAAKLSETSEKLLGILNISRIVNETGKAMGLPNSFAESATEEPVIGLAIRVPHPTPVLYAQALERLPAPEGIERPMIWSDQAFPKPSSQIQAIRAFLGNYLVALSPKLESLSGSAIPVPELPENYLPPANIASETNIQLDNYQVSDDNVIGKIKLSHAGYLQFSHPWYPTVSLLIDHQPVKTIRSSIGFIVTPISAGTHEFEIVPERSELRKRIGILSGVALIATLCSPLVGNWLRNRKA